VRQRLAVQQQPIDNKLFYRKSSAPCPGTTAAKKSAKFSAAANQRSSSEAQLVPIRHVISTGVATKRSAAKPTNPRPMFRANNRRQKQL